MQVIPKLAERVLFGLHLLAFILLIAACLVAAFLAGYALSGARL